MTQLKLIPTPVQLRFDPGLEVWMREQRGPVLHYPLAPTHSLAAVPPVSGPSGDGVGGMGREQRLKGVL